MTDTTLDHIEAIAFDVDGCLVLSDQPGGEGGDALPGAAAALDWASTTGRPRVVMTNGSSHPPPRVAQHLRGLGLPVDDHEVLTPPVVAAKVCRDRWPGQSVLAFGGSGVLDVLDAAGVPLASWDETDVAAVVVGWDTEFNYDKVQVATRAIRAGAELLISSDAKQFAARGDRQIGLTGFIGAGLAFVADQPYEIVGKPSQMAMQAVLDHLQRPPEAVLVVGDDLSLELAMARTAGCTSALVTTGVSSTEDVAALSPTQRPDLVVDSLHELLALLPGGSSTVSVGRTGRA